jgi:hypothetical protein
MALTVLETSFVFVLVSIMVVAFGWLIRRGARRNYLAERAELRMAAGKIGSLVSREFSHESCVGCGGVDMDLIAIRDSGVSADFRCTDCGTEGSASASADASAKTRKSWEQYSTLRKAFEKGHKSTDPEDVGVRFRVWVVKT